MKKSRVSRLKIVFGVARIVEQFDEFSIDGRQVGTLLGEGKEAFGLHLGGEGGGGKGGGEEGGGGEGGGVEGGGGEEVSIGGGTEGGGAIKQDRGLVALSIVDCVMGSGK